MQAALLATIEPIFDFARHDLQQVVADLEVLRRYNPQRFEMEHLTAITYEDPKQQICLGYKDVSEQEFWVRGHLPGRPRMPEVLICEAAGQMCSYYVQKHDIVGRMALGFAGMNDVQVFGSVFPNDRLIMLGKLMRVRPGVMVVWKFQGYVRGTLVCDGSLKGVPLPVDWITRQQSLIDSGGVAPSPSASE